MSDQHRIIKTTSWGQKILSSLGGVIAGVFLFIAAFLLLWWNEGQSHDRILTLQEGLSSVVLVAAESLDPQNTSKLVHFSGLAQTSDTLSDPDFNLRENVLALKRTVLMLQWTEEQDSKTIKHAGGSETTETVYSYKKVWVDHPIDSADFSMATGHENPPMALETKEIRANEVSVGAFKLTQDFINKLDMYEDYNLSPENHQALPEPQKTNFKLVGNEFIKGDPANPQIGDLRVKFQIIRNATVSVIGRQNTTGVEPHLTKKGVIALLEPGQVSADLMFARENETNQLLTWAVRAGGFIMMWVGLVLVLRPIAILGDVVPIVGALAGAGIGLVTGLFSMGLSLLVIAMAWLFSRPIIGGGLLVLGIAALLGALRMGKSKKNSNKQGAG